MQHDLHELKTAQQNQSGLHSCFQNKAVKKKKKETVQALPQIMCTKWVSWDAVKTVQKNYERKYAPSLMCYYVKPGPAVWSSTFVAWFLQLPNNGGQNHVISCLNKYYWLCYKQKPFCLLQAVPCAVHQFSGK